MKKPIVVAISISILLSAAVLAVGGDTANEVSNEELNGEPEPEQLAGSAWPKFGFNNRGTSRSPHDTSHIDGTEKWNFSTEGDVFSSPRDRSKRNYLFRLLR